MRPSSFRAMTLSIVAAVMILSQWDAWAFMNPEAFRKGVPEAVKIQVVASQVEKSGDVSRYYLAARVLEVHHSATNLKPGGLILIVYRANLVRLKREQAAMDKKAKRGWAGPQILGPPSTLKSGDICVAYLAWVTGTGVTGRVYTPAAHQYSFEPVKAGEE